MTSFSSCEQTEKNDKIYKYMQQIALSISMIKIKVSFSSVKNKLHVFKQSQN